MLLALPESESVIRLHFAHSLSNADLLRFCSENRPLQVEREATGELTIMTPTSSKIGRLESRICAALDRWAAEHGQGDCFGPSAGFLLPDSSVRAADAHWLSHRRWNALSPAEQEGFAPVCPEFVIEVRSTSDDLATLCAKMRMWLANGAELAWLADPERKVVEIFRPGEIPEVLDDPETVSGTGPVQGFQLALRKLWA